MDPPESFSSFKSSRPLRYQNIEKSDDNDTTTEKNILSSTRVCSSNPSYEESERSQETIISSNSESISTDGVCSTYPSYGESERSQETMISSKSKNISTDGACSSNPSYEKSERSQETIICSKSKGISIDGVCSSNPSYEKSQDFLNIENSYSYKGAEKEKDVPSFNKNVLPSHANTYQLERFKRNAIIIFNHEKIDGYDIRKGTQEDEKTLRDTFSNFGFEFHKTKKNMKKIEILSALKEFSAKNFTDYGCVVIAVLTHGARNGLLEASDEGNVYSDQEILSYFKARTRGTLVTKPIILIIQACRGERSTKGVEIRNIALRSKTIPKDAKEEFETYFLPLESDMLVFHSSYPGKSSYRPEDGSWFIQTLCKQINQLYRTHDLESIFTEVKRKVAIDKFDSVWNPNTDEHDIHKQMPTVTSTLIRKLYLREYKDRPPIMPAFVPQDFANQTFTDLELQLERPLYCDCYKNIFDYMKTCLRNVVKKYPRDEIAKTLLSLAETESGINEDDVKNKLKIIYYHIRTHYKHEDFHKFIYYIKTENQISCAQIDTLRTNDSIFFKKWIDCCNTESLSECCTLKNIAFMSMAGVIAYYFYGSFRAN